MLPIPTKPQKDQQNPQLKPGCGSWLPIPSLPQWVPELEQNPATIPPNGCLRANWGHLLNQASNSTTKSLSSGPPHIRSSPHCGPQPAARHNPTAVASFSQWDLHLQVVAPRPALIEALTHTVKGQGGGPLASLRWEDPAKTR